MTTRTKRARRNIFLICGILVAILLAFLLLPLPKRIHKTMYGAAITKDGTIGEPVIMEVTGWNLEYLLREDVLKVSMDFQGVDNPLYLYMRTPDGTTFPLSPDFLLTSVMAYDVEGNQMVGGYFAFSNDFSRCALVGLDGKNYVCSQAPGDDLVDIMHTFDSLMFS